MKVRPVCASDDVFEISSIYEQSWKYAYKDIVPKTFLDSIPEGKWAKHLGREDMHHLVLEEEGRLIGTASCCASRWEHFDGFGEIVSIYLLPADLGKGKGAPLLRECLDLLAKDGYDRVMLWVLDENLPARHFYEKHGFVFSGEYRDDKIGGKTIREAAYTSYIGNGYM
ncbi:MAG: GNAT family N-acetyltransferase [Ruminococcus sp.]|nr:GNAT family N-acetyltransferase [Ruminococcus sp.]